MCKFPESSCDHESIMAGKQKCTEEILASWDMNNAKEPENLQISSTILWLWVNHDGPITDRFTQ